MDKFRSLLLSKFFERHGTLANQHDIFHSMVVNCLKEDHEVELPNEDAEQSIIDGTNYDMKVSNGKDDFEIPMITKEGYFIIHGIKKVPLIQESKSRYSMFFTHTNNVITCETRFLESRNTMKLVYSNDIYIRVLMDKTSKKINIVDLFHIWNNNMDLGISCQVMAYRYLRGKERECEVMSAINDIGDDIDMELYKYFEKNILGKSTVKEAFYTIIYILSKCASIKLGSMEATDRDHYGFKVFHTSGHIISSLMRRAFNKRNGSIRKRLDDELYSVMKTGSVEINNVRKSKMVIQVGTRSTLDVISSTRRVVVPADDNSMSHKMRQIHVSQRGFICPSETPEGKQVGLTKNLALTCLVSPRMDNIYDKIISFIIQEPGDWVIYNGLVVGFSKEDTYQNILLLKKEYPYMSLNIDSNGDIHVRTWEGRLMRPLIVTHGNVFAWNTIFGKSLDQLLEEGIIEYLDPLEIDLKKVAKLSYKGHPEAFTHMEIHPCTMFGVTASNIPYVNHDHGARSIFASAMLKQAMQCPPDLDSEGKYLIYAQNPIVYTQPKKILDLDPNGINALVSIMSFQGYNQEDAIIVKKSFAERGGFSSINVKVKRMDPGYGKRNIIFHADNNTIWCIDGNDEKIVKNYHYQKVSNDNVLSTVEYRTPIMGDKLSTRHAQKGVIGLIVPDVDMPFTEGGITPDIIINPHGVPSRMTMGQMIEGFLGRRCSIEGKFVDGTPFSNVHIDPDEKVMLTSGIDGNVIHEYGTVDIVYYVALTHQVSDKIYIRSTGPRNEFSHQPVAGRAKDGGLRFGEMEMDLLIAHGSSSSLANVLRNSDMETFRVCFNCRYFPIDGSVCRLCDSKDIREKEMPKSISILKDLMLINNMNLSF